MNPNKTTGRIVAGMLLGIGVGYGCHQMAKDASAAAALAGYFSIVSETFLRLIKMIIAPLIFATLVTGVASMGDTKTVGRIGGKALIWFIVASLIAALLGMFFVDVLQPGHAMKLSIPVADTSNGIAASGLDLKDFLTHVVPKSIFEAMAQNEILQILVFSLFFGLAAGSVKSSGRMALIHSIEQISQVMLTMTDYVMKFAPVGVFAALAGIVTVQGLGVLVSYGKLIGEFYLALAVLWIVLLLFGFLFLRRSVFDLLKMIRAPIMIAFSTASSEAAYPRLMELLGQFGVDKNITGLVLPLGYSFNLVGSMMYQIFAVLFVAQAYDIHISLAQQITMLLVLLVSSKGTAGVSRASLIVVAAMLPIFGLPAAGLFLIMGIDQFLDMGRTATNVLGNGIATAVVAQWEGPLREPTIKAQA